MKLLKARAIAERNGCPEIFMKESPSDLSQLPSSVVEEADSLVYFEIRVVDCVE